MDSTIAREADGVLYTNAGPEISIASTKALPHRYCALLVRALPRQVGKFSKEQRRKYIEIYPDKLETLLKSAPAACERLVDKFYKVETSSYGSRDSLSRSHDGAWLKEVSYIHAWKAIPPAKPNMVPTP